MSCVSINGSIGYISLLILELCARFVYNPTANRRLDDVGWMFVLYPIVWVDRHPSLKMSSSSPITNYSVGYVNEKK